MKHLMYFVSVHSNDTFAAEYFRLTEIDSMAAFLYKHADMSFEQVRRYIDNEVTLRKTALKVDVYGDLTMITIGIVEVDE